MKDRFVCLKTLSICLLIMSALISSGNVYSQDIISLAGQWKLALDPNDQGIEEGWYQSNLEEDYTIQLPSSIQEYDFGYKLSKDTKWTATNYEQFYELEKYAPYRSDENFKIPFWLTSDTHYQGAAWYQRNIEIPDNWSEKRITLQLERSHWGSMVFVDNQLIGADSSLATPHYYNLTEALSPGPHTLTVRVDNRMLFEIGKNSHSITDHTQTNWNGLVGDISLKASDPFFIEDVQIYPDIEQKNVHVKVQVKNITGTRQSGQIRMQAVSSNSKVKHKLDPVVKSFNDFDSGLLELTYSMGKDPLLWDEFDPQFYTMHVELENDSLYLDTHSTTFGMRDFTVDGTRFNVNGRPIFLRGTLESAIFPETGYPSMSKKEWKHHFSVAKKHGLNHIRFHSWGPPKAAFEAANEVGIYLQVEASVWANQGATLGDGKPVDQFVIDESERIMKEFGNHPSFVMFAHGNEPGGENYQTFLKKLVNKWKVEDPRRVYTAGAAWPAIEENDFHNLPGPRIQNWGEGLNSIINSEFPSTNWNFKGDIENFEIPVIGHEIGHWTVYPNFREMSKYTGVLYPHNFEVFQDFLEQNHMLFQAHDFLMASGKLQLLCYKADIEAALRTPDYGGYQMLDLHDFPGQGTALVGILDPFWDSKPYVNSEEFSRFSSETVPLAIMEKRIFSNNEIFKADLQIAHFAKETAANVPVQWKITNSKNQIEASGVMVTDLHIGNDIRPGTLSLDLNTFDTAQKLNLEVKVGKLGVNDWDFWVYPENVNTVPSSEIIVTQTLTPDIERHLREGAKVLLQLNGSLKEGKGKEVEAGFSTVFWNTAWTNGQLPHTMGVLVDPSHRMFHKFPTEYHTNWQWWDIVHDVHPMILNDFPPKLTPSIQMIDTWFEARKLGLLFEAKVGSGKLVVTSIDFENDLDSRLAAKNLYHSLLNKLKLRST